MANRYSKYHQVDYVGMPLDAYQMAAGAIESENLNRLQNTKNSYDAMEATESAYNPDSLLKKQLMDTVRQKIEGMAAKNLKGSDVLMELGKLVNDPGVINQLSGIQTNTVNYKAAMAANKKYLEDTGNDINTLQSDDVIANYNKLGAEGFKPGMMSGYTPGKYVDVEGDIRTALDKKRAEGWEEDGLSKDGMWIQRSSGSTRTLAGLLEDAGVMLGNPKYQKQLQTFNYVGLRGYGGNTDPAKAILNYNKQMGTRVSSQIADYTKGLIELKAKQKKLLDAKKPDIYAASIEDATRMITKLKEQQQDYNKDVSGQVYQSDMLKGLAYRAVAGLPIHNVYHKMDVNPYAMLSMKMGAEFELWKKKQKILNPDEPINIPMFSGAVGEFQDAGTQAFNKQFGDDPGGVMVTKADEAWSATKNIWGVELGAAAALAGGQSGMLGTILGGLKPGAIGKVSGLNSWSGTTQHVEIKDPAKLKVFTDFALKNGFQVNPVLIGQNGKTPESVKEIEKLIGIHTMLKNGKNSVGFGIALNTGLLDNHKLTGYILNSINQAGNVVDEKNNPVDMSEIFGTTNEAKVGSVLYSGFTGKTINAVFQPTSNKVAITLGNKVYFINPDIQTQEENQNVMNLINPATSIGKGGVGNMQYLSVGTYLADGSRFRGLFHPLAKDMTSEQADKIATQLLGGLPTGLNVLPNDNAVVLKLDQGGNNIATIPYGLYIQNKAIFDEQFSVPGTSVLFVTKDNHGKVNFVKPVNLPGSNENISAESLIQLNAHRLFEGAFKSMLPSTEQKIQENSDRIGSDIDVGNPAGKSPAEIEEEEHEQQQQQSQIKY